MTVLANAKTYPWSEYTLPSGQRAYAIYGVPFFAPAGSGDRDDLEGHEFDGAWMREAVERFAKRKADNYWAPVHLGHQDQEHPTDNRPFAGFLDNMRMTHMEFDGESQDVLVGDLVDIPPAVFQEIQSGAWPYRSIEIRPPYDEVSSLALLSTIPPHHKFGVLALDSVGTATAMFQAPMRLMRQPAEVSAVQFSQARSCWAQQYATGGQTVAGGHMRLGVSDDDKGKAMPCDKTEKKPPFPFADEEPDEDEEDPEEDPEEDTISMEDDDGSDEEDDEQFSEDQARDEGGRFSGGGGDRAKPVKSRKGDEEARVRREQKKWQKQRDANRQNEMREIRSRRKDRKRSVSSMYADDGTPIQFGEPPDDDEYDDEEVIEPEDEMAPEGETVEGEAESFGGEETPEEEAAEVEQGGEVQTEGVPPEGAPPAPRRRLRRAPIQR